MATGKPAARAVLDRVASIGDKAVSLVSACLAVCLILCGGYALWHDFLYTQNQAFGAAGDMLRYRPEAIEDGSAASSPGLGQVNEDYRAWLTIDGTNIDYPVMQGKDDLYYAYHDYKNNDSLTGALYFAAANSADCSSNYNLMYGHHMEADTLFGTLDNFADLSYFNNHSKGVLATLGNVYDLVMFAVVETDAYNSAVYSTGNRDLAALKSFIAKNSVIYDEAVAAGATKVLAMSTCENAQTNGRLVVFAAMVERGGNPVNPDAPDNPSGGSAGMASALPPSGGPAAPAAPGSAPVAVGSAPSPSAVSDAPIAPAPPAFESKEPKRDVVEEQASSLAKRFHPAGDSNSDAWALVNLICLVLTIYVLVPFGHVKAKLRRTQKMRKVNAAKAGLRDAERNGGLLDEQQTHELERIYREALNARGMNPATDVIGVALAQNVTDGEFEDAVRGVYYQDEPFGKRLRIGLAGELLISVVALVAFVLTEDVRYPMVLIDAWTPLMLFLLLACWVIDVRFVRYHDNVPDIEYEDAASSETSAAPAVG